MTVQCITCKHFDMKSNREMASAGRAGHCPKTLQLGQYISAMKERDCKDFEAVPAEEVEGMGGKAPDLPEVVQTEEENNEQRYHQTAAKPQC